MVLVGISWAIGLFVSTFLLLPPAQHVAVQAAALAALLQNNRSGGGRCRGAPAAAQRAAGTPA